MEKINVPKSQISVSRQGVVTVNSHELAIALIQNNKDVISDLGIKANEISISKAGKILLNDKALATKLGNFLKTASGDANGICGVRCGSKISIGGEIRQI